MEDHKEHVDYVVGYVNDFIDNNEVARPVEFIDALIKELEQLKASMYLTRPEFDAE